MRAFRTGPGSMHGVAATVGAGRGIGTQSFASGAEPKNASAGIVNMTTRGPTQELQVPRDAERYFGVSLTAKF